MPVNHTLFGGTNFGAGIFGPGAPVGPVVSTITAAYNVVVLPYPDNILAITIMVIPGDNIALEFNFVNVFASGETCVVATFTASSNDVASIKRFYVGTFAQIELSNTMTPGETVQIECAATGSLGTQAAGFVDLVAFNSF